MAPGRLFLCFVWAAVLLAPGCMSQRLANMMSNLPPPGQLSVVHYFPEHPTKQFQAGQVVNVVVSAHNDATKPYNLSAIIGSLNSPTDYNMFLYNFSETVYFDHAAPGKEVSLEYAFRTDPATPARDFLVALHLLYSDNEGNMFASTFFNGTIEVVEPKRIVDTDLLLMFLMIAGVIAFIGYLSYATVAERLGIKLGKGGKRKVRTKTVVAKSALNDDEWVKGTNYEVSKRKKATQRGKLAPVAAPVAAQ